MNAASEDPSYGEDDTFARQVLEEINTVRTQPRSIVRALQEQMNQIDDDQVLSIPGRDPIQLEEGREAVSHTSTIII